MQLSDPAALVADSPQDPMAHYQLGLAQLDSGSAVAAATSLRRSLELGLLDSTQAWHDDPLGPYHAAADALLEAEEYAAAEECWRYSLQLDGQNVAVRERLAATLRLSGRLAEAADELHDTLALLPEEDEEVRCWLLLDLGAVIEDIAPIEGTGAEWPCASSTSSSASSASSACSCSCSSSCSSSSSSSSSLASPAPTRSASRSRVSSPRRGRLEGTASLVLGGSAWAWS